MHRACEPRRTPERKIVSQGGEKGHLAVRECARAAVCSACSHGAPSLKGTVPICCRFPALTRVSKVIHLKNKNKTDAGSYAKQI